MTRPELSLPVSLPDAAELPRWLQLGAEPLDLSPFESDLLGNTLLDPLRDLLARPSKQFRARLVQLGARLACGGEGGEQRDRLEAFSELVEALHAGSLVVDDIQDGSRMRRGAPSLHVRYGVPVALNAGNWLYFWPLAGLRNRALPPELELEATRLCLDILLKAHFGQSIDVGTQVDTVPQTEVEAVVRLSIRLKTGALTGLALRLGALATGAGPELLAAFERFGSAFGSALQMLDDTANFSADHAATTDPQQSYRKRFEDLRLRRPTWIWAAASRLETADYRRFCDAVERLPDESFLRPWVELSGLIPKAKELARLELAGAMRDLRPFVQDEQAWAELEELRSHLESAYC